MDFFTDNENRIPKGEVRTRFAPSPTGFMHVGGLRTAMYEWLIAKKLGGKFILRIEDTDTARFVEGATEVIFRTLRDAGLDYDEGPDVGGPVGSYTQSERKPLYRPYAELLAEKGAAYYCFCEHVEADSRDHSELGVPSETQDPCRNLTPDEVKKRLDSGCAYVIRLKTPTEGTTVFHDLVFGDISAENASLDDMVLLKSDGLPTYNFANVVDDHLMGITHVIRGTEYLSSSPKYNLLYDAFGWEIPVYIHVSPIMRDAQHKLSKRYGDPTYEDLLEKGYLKDAILNYVALLGWSPGGEREIFSLAELAECFTLEGLSKSPAIFDINKLTYFNGVYIRALTPEEFHACALPYIRKAVTRADLDTVLLASLLQARCELLSDIPEQLDFLEELPEYDAELFVHKKSKTTAESSIEALNDILPVLEGLDNWTLGSIHEALFALIEQKGVKNALILWPLRVALAGKPVTPGGGVELCVLLGKEETLRRVKKGIEKLR